MIALPDSALRGSLPPLVTPFRDGASPDVERRCDEILAGAGAL